MTRTFRSKRWKFSLRGRTSLRPEQFVTRGILSSVHKKTLSSYRSKVTNYLTFLRHLNLPYDKQSFISFLDNILAQGAAGSTLNSYRAALAFFQQASLTPEWARDKDITKACQGYAHRHKATAAHRGSITIEMLHQLCSLDPILATPIALLFFGVLRISELLLIQSGDLCSDSRTAALWIRTDKRLTARSAINQAGHWKPIVNQEFVVILSPIQSSFPGGTPLFKWVSSTHINQLIKHASIVFKWPSDVMFDGAHCLRHGGATYIKHLDSELARRAACMSSGTFTHYSRDNLTRTNK